MEENIRTCTCKYCLSGDMFQCDKWHKSGAKSEVVGYLTTTNNQRERV